MVFSSAIFLFIFLPVVFVLDRVLPGIRTKNLLLLIASLIFYSFGQPVYLPLLLLSVVLNYVCGLLAAGKHPKLGVGIAVVGGIGLLAVFKYADFAILTSDNPRRENPYDIIGDVEPVLKRSGKPYLVEVERRTALQKALAMLRPGDVLALCGKGHEDYQAIDGVTIYLDEHRIVRDWLTQHQLTEKR